MKAGYGRGRCRGRGGPWAGEGLPTRGRPQAMPVGRSRAPVAAWCTPFKLVFSRPSSCPLGQLFHTKWDGLMLTLGAGFGGPPSPASFHRRRTTLRAALQGSFC